MPAKTAARPRHLKQPLLLFALGFGSGLAPRGPGTAGTAVGVVLYLGLATVSPGAAAIAAAAAVVAGIPLCASAARRLGVHDDPAIVWDEIAGYLVAMLWVPAEPAWVVLGFALFRILDVAKPWPIGFADRHFQGGLGIMADDVIAGLATCAGLHLLLWLTV